MEVNSGKWVQTKQEFFCSIADKAYINIRVYTVLVVYSVNSFCPYKLVNFTATHKTENTQKLKRHNCSSRETLDMWSITNISGKLPSQYLT